jgi:hypothetical protein
MNRDLLRAVGCGKAVDAVDNGKCPSCGKPIQAFTEFVDDLSRREFGISGLCQECQDRVFGKGEPKQ